MLYADTEGIPLDLINNFSIDIQFYQVAVLLKVSISWLGILHIYNIWNTVISCRSKILFFEPSRYF